MASAARAGVAGGIANTAQALGNVLMSVYGNRQANALAEQERADTNRYRDAELALRQSMEDRLREGQRIEQEQALRDTNDRFREFMAGREERGYGYREAPLPTTGLAVPTAVPNVGSFILERARDPVRVGPQRLSDRMISTGYDPARDRVRNNAEFESGLTASRQADLEAQRHANAMALVRERAAAGREAEGTDVPTLRGEGGRLFPDTPRGREEFLAWQARYRDQLGIGRGNDDPLGLLEPDEPPPGPLNLPTNSSGLLGGILPGTERGPMQAPPAASAGSRQDTITPEEFEQLVEMGYTEEEIESMFTVRE